MQRRYPVRSFLSGDGKTRIYTDYHGSACKMTGVLCPDGIERTVWTGYPDTFFTIPGQCQAFGRTIAGYVTAGDDAEGNERHIFVPSGKNAGILTGD